MLEKITSMPAMRIRRERGFTLNELLVVIGIVAILASLAVPSYQWATDKYRLKGAADTLRGDLQYARVQAISNNQSVYVSIIATGSAWCYGMNVGSPCTCTTPNNCTLKQVSSNDYTGITLASNFASNPTFDPVRGVVTPAGNAVFQSNLGKQTQVNLSLIGKIGVCDPAATGSGYPTC